MTWSIAIVRQSVSQSVSHAHKDHDHDHDHDHGTHTHKFMAESGWQRDGGGGAHTADLHISWHFGWLTGLGLGGLRQRILSLLQLYNVFV